MNSSGETAPRSGSRHASGQSCRHIVTSVLSGFRRAAPDGAYADAGGDPDHRLGASYRLVAKPDYRRLGLYAKGFDPVWAAEYRGSATVAQHQALLDCALKRDAEGAKTILTEHINSCVAHALSIGTLK